MHKNSKVKSLAVCLFALSFTLLGYFFAKTRDSDGVQQTWGTKVADNVAVFRKVEFNVDDVEGSKARILADRINKDRDNVFLSMPIIYANKNGDNIKLTSKMMSTSAGKCVFDSDVRVELFDKINIKTNIAHVDVKAKKAEGESKINLKYRDISINADSYFIDLNSNFIKFRKNVILRRTNGVLHCDVAKCYLSKDSGQYDLKKSILDGAISYLSPTHCISTDGRIEIDESNADFHAFTTVTGVTQKKRYKLESNKMKISFRKNEIQCIRCNNGFRFYIANKQISGNSCVYKNNIVNVTGNVVIKTENGVARGDKASYNVSTGKLNMQNIGGVLFKNGRSA